MFTKGDKRINRAGRPTIAEKLLKDGEPASRRALKDRELLLLLRKIKPHLASAILKAADIMQNEEAKHADQLKAATILLENYRRLVIDVYDAEEDGTPAEEVQQQNSPLFSLTVIEGDKQE